MAVQAPATLPLTHALSHKVEAGALDGLRDLLDQPSAEARLAATSALQSLAADPRNAAALVANGAVRPLVNHLASDDPRIQARPRPGPRTPLQTEDGMSSGNEHDDMFTSCTWHPLNTPVPRVPPVIACAWTGRGGELRGARGELTATWTRRAAQENIALTLKKMAGTHVADTRAPMLKLGAVSAANKAWGASPKIDAPLAGLPRAPAPALRRPGARTHADCATLPARLRQVCCSS